MTDWWRAYIREHLPEAAPFVDGIVACAEAVEGERDQARAHLRELAAPHEKGERNLLALLDLYLERAERAEGERNEARARVAALEKNAAMACETPPEGCECPGCTAAREASEALG